MNPDWLEDLERRLVDTHADPLAWKRAAESISASVGARGAAILPLRGRDPQIPATDSLAQLFETYTRDGWAERDARYAGVPRLVQTGILADQDFIDPTQMSRHPFWRDLLEPHGVWWFCGVLIQAKDDLWCLALQRTSEQGPFQSDEQAMLARVAAPLSRAATLSRLLDLERLDGAVDALSTVGRPAFVLNRECNVLGYNGEAEVCLGNDLTIRDHQLVALQDASATARLQRHFRAVLWSSVLQSSAELAPVLIARSSGRPMLVQAVVLKGSSSRMFASGRLLVLVNDLEETRIVTADILQKTFNLTPGESRVARALASGAALPQVGAVTGYSYETVRSYLKAIFAKMEVRSQPELVALLALLAGF